MGQNVVFKDTPIDPRPLIVLPELSTLPNDVMKLGISQWINSLIRTQPLTANQLLSRGATL